MARRAPLREHEYCNSQYFATAAIRPSVGCDSGNRRDAEFISLANGYPVRLGRCCEGRTSRLADAEQADLGAMLPLRPAIPQLDTLDDAAIARQIDGTGPSTGGDCLPDGQIFSRAV